jgi:hypothetical protein
MLFGRRSDDLNATQHGLRAFPPLSVHVLIGRDGRGLDEPLCRLPVLTLLAMVST